MLFLRSNSWCVSFIVDLFAEKYYLKREKKSANIFEFSPLDREISSLKHSALREKLIQFEIF